MYILALQSTLVWVIGYFALYLSLSNSSVLTVRRLMSEALEVDMEELDFLPILVAQGFLASWCLMTGGMRVPVLVGMVLFGLSTIPSEWKRSSMRGIRLTSSHCVTIWLCYLLTSL